MASAKHPNAKHPKELLILSLCAGSVRFSFWGVGNLLVLYLLEFYHFKSEHAAHIYGIFTGAAAFLPLLGGYIADRWNYHQPMFLGAILTAIGCFLLAFGNIFLLYLSLIILSAGFALFIPSNLAVFNHVYREHHHLRESGFTLFYSAFNIGVFLAMISMGYLAHKFGWSLAFILAGVVQTAGILPIAWYYKKYHQNVKGINPVTKETSKTATLENYHIKRMGVVIILGLFSIFFWAAYNQGWSSMSIFTLYYTKKVIWGINIPTAWILSAESFFLILLSPLFAKLYTYFHKIGKDFSPSTIMGMSLIAMAFCFSIIVFGSQSIPSGAKEAFISPLYLIFAYFLMAISELLFGPMGLSMVTQLSPPRFIGFLVGYWFVCMGIGNYLGGVLAGMISSYGKLSTFFSFIVFFCIIPAFFLFIFTKKINRMKLSRSD